MLVLIVLILIDHWEVIDQSDQSINPITAGQEGPTRGDRDDVMVSGRD